MPIFGHISYGIYSGTNIILNFQSVGKPLLYVTCNGDFDHTFKLHSSFWLPIFHLANAEIQSVIVT